jgi:hypothetical protein
MKTYFCPTCGRGYESSQCGGHAKPFRVDMRCPKCDTPVEISGAAFIVLGLLIALFTGLVLDTTTPLVGGAVGAAFAGFGVVRLARLAWYDVGGACARFHQLAKF